MFNQKKVGSLLSYVGIFIKAVISILYTSIMLSFIGNEEFGVFNLSYSIVSYLSLLSLGFVGSYVRFYFKYKISDNEESIAKLNGLFLSLFSLIALISIISGIILTNNIDVVISGELTATEIKLSKQLMVIMIINIALTFIDSVFNSYISANEKFIFQKVLDIFKTLLNPFIGIPLLLMGYRSQGLAIAMTTATLISLTLNIYYSMRKLNMKFIFNKFDLSLFKEISGYSAFIFINMITDQLNWQMDKIILGKFVGSIAIAVYSIGAQLNQYFMQFSSSISNVFTPQIHAIAEMDDRVNYWDTLFRKIGRIQFLVISYVFLAYFALGKYFITEIWLNPSYMDSYYIGLILMFSTVVPLIQNLGIEITRALNKHMFRSIIYILIALFNVILSIPLTVKLGPIGSAIGTAISTIIGNGFVINLYYSKIIGLNIKKFWKEILLFSKGLILPMCVSLLISIINISSFLMFLLLATSFTGIFAISIWVFSLNQNEKANIFSIIKKLKK